MPKKATVKRGGKTAPKVTEARNTDAPIDPDAPRDQFERLVNTPGSGSLQEMATAVEDITVARGFMTDLDPYHFREGGPLGIRAGLSPTEFYERHLRDRLQRSPFWKHADVICTGNGLALVQRFTEPILFRHETDVRRFDIMVKIVHASLPSDPDQGGVCQMPRVPGSVNSKRDQPRPVVRLAEGTPITNQQFEQFGERIIAEPMTVVLETLFGSTRICPCPLCGRADAQLTPAQKGKALRCSKCGQHTMGKFYSTILLDRESVNQFEETEETNE